jgi:hypothetical protein
MICSITAYYHCLVYQQWVEWITDVIHNQVLRTYGSLIQLWSLEPVSHINYFALFMASCLSNENNEQKEQPGGQGVHFLEQVQTGEELG